jgi:hypothetical protein
MIYDQGNDGACALFPPWRHFWRRWISGVILMVFGPLLQGIDHSSGTFRFCNSSFFFWLCAYVLPLRHYVVADAGCNWYLCDIIIFSLLKK